LAFGSRVAAAEVLKPKGSRGGEVVVRLLRRMKSEEASDRSLSLLLLALSSLSLLLLSFSGLGSPLLAAEALPLFFRLGFEEEW
jgi:hypothetical protein